PIVSELESDLRLTCMHSALSDIRHQLRLRSCLNRFKVKNVKGQRPNTRARVMQMAVDANVQAATNRYIRHREAYLSLVGAGDWEKTYCALNKKVDLVNLNEKTVERLEENSVLEAKSGESKHVVSWVWYQDASDEGTLTDDLRLEWFRACARAWRWREEIGLVLEEMDCVLHFCDWEASRWGDRASSRSVVDEGLQDGLRAYAWKQADMYKTQKATFKKEFKDVRAEVHKFLDRFTPGGA
ncbi:hypothetical protein K488DRAFT_59094, partial [Vararia minispora EC-137]